MPITTFVLTGGPCGGKSTAEELLRSKLPELGVKVIFVKETATDIFMSGIDVADMGRNEDVWQAFQEQMIRTQLDEFANKMAFAKLCSSDNIALIFDRGIKDNVAYMGKAAYIEALGKIVQGGTENGSSFMASSEVLDHHLYDAVLMLVSAARGVPQHYNLDNAARHESVEDAVKLDLKTLDAWTGHPGLVIVNNTKKTEQGRAEVPFEEKMNAVFQAVCRALGMPIPTEEKKFLVKGLDKDQLPDNAVVSQIRQIYLRENDGMERRLRSTAINGETVFSYSEIFTNMDGFRTRRSRTIAESEFDTLIADRDTTLEVLQKERTSFTYKDQYFKLDTILRRKGKPVILLEVDLTQEAPLLDLPPFVTVTDVSTTKGFKNAELARVDPLDGEIARGRTR